MPFEVEQKFPLPPDSLDVLGRLTALGGIPEQEVFQQDLYFNHPGHDFAQTDEALRIRTVGEHNVVTYKGPKLDPHIKTREELEVPLGDGREVADNLGQILLRLGFRAVRPVRKQRVIWNLAWNNRTWELAWDTVEGLGIFLEIETIAPNQQDLPSAQAALSDLARLIGLDNSERKSYLEMLLERGI